MCRSPITLPNGQKVACRECDRCKYNYIKDWVGRCIAEEQTSIAVRAVTLTYAPIVDDEGNKVDRHERAAILTYTDIQDYFRKLRAAGYFVRYLVAGELGGLKGRAHWHLILFFQNKVPPHEIYSDADPKFHWDEFWTHGHQVWKEPHIRSVGYVCKYIQKDIHGAEGQSKFEMSKEPAIGGHYFSSLAKQYVLDGLAPQGPFYRFDKARKKNGEMVEYYLSGTSVDRFREAYVTWFHIIHPGKHLVSSEFVDEWLDRQVLDWRSERWFQEADEAALARQKAEASEARKSYRDEHNRHYFGVNMQGFYYTDWEPDGEKEWQEEQRRWEEAEYITLLQAELDEADTKRFAADKARFGDAYGKAGKPRTNSHDVVRWKLAESGPGVIPYTIRSGAVTTLQDTYGSVPTKERAETRPSRPKKKWSRGAKDKK